MQLKRAWLVHLELPLQLGPSCPLKRAEQQHVPSSVGPFHDEHQLTRERQERTGITIVTAGEAQAKEASNLEPPSSCHVAVHPWPCELKNNDMSTNRQTEEMAIALTSYCQCTKCKEQGSERQKAHKQQRQRKRTKDEMMKCQA